MTKKQKQTVEAIKLTKELEKLKKSIELDTRKNILTYNFIYSGGRLVFANAQEVDVKIRQIMKEVA